MYRCIANLEIDLDGLGAVSYTHLDVYKRQVVGATTKRNLSSLTPYVMAALFGMIIVSLVMIGARFFNWTVLSGFSDTRCV